MRSREEFYGKLYIDWNVTKYLDGLKKKNEKLVAIQKMKGET